MSNIIKAGYRVTVASWENDADGRRTMTKDGLTIEEAQFVVEMLSHMESRSNGGSTRNMWGNMYNPKDSEREEFGKFFIEIVQRHAPASFTVMGWDDVDIAEYVEELDDDPAGLICEFFYDYMGGGEFFTRVADKVTVEHIPTEIVIQDVTHLFNLGK